MKRSAYAMPTEGAMCVAAGVQVQCSAAAAAPEDLREVHVAALPEALGPAYAREFESTFAYLE